MSRSGKVVDISRETLIAWKGGSVRAFEEIVEAARARAYSVAVGMVGNMEDARDLSQEAFMAAHHARKSFDADKPFFPWFYKILRNRCLNFIRKRKSRREISIDVLVEKESVQASPDAVLVTKEKVEALWRGLFELSPEHREIIVLRCFQELTYREIADSLGISEGTVMSRLFYARKALCRALEDFSNRSGQEGDDAK